MDKTNKYFKMIITIVWFFVIGIVLGQVKYIFELYNINYYKVDEVIFSLITVVRTITIIGIIAGLGYLAYAIFAYYTSSFYAKYKVSAAECLFKGYLDFHKLYSIVTTSKEIKNLHINFNTMTVYFTNAKTEESYAIIYRDIFGKIKGDTKGDTWSIVSKPRKQYGYIQYKKEIKIPSPYYVNKKDIQKQDPEFKYQNFVLISGFYTFTEKPQEVISTFELMAFLGK